MGKLDSTGTLAQTRGRQGGVVVSSNQTGSYARAWFMPRVPRTPDQLAWSRNWAQWAKAWAALTDVQRAAWDTASTAATWTRADWFGQTYQPSGFNLWMMIAAMKNSVGVALSATPPSGTPPGDIITTEMSLAGVDPVTLARVCLLTVGQNAPAAWAYVEIQTGWLISTAGAARNKPFRPFITQAVGTNTYIDGTPRAAQLVGWIYPETRCWYRWRGWTSGFLPGLWTEDYATPGPY
jgi:hypothetical protein